MTEEDSSLIEQFEGKIRKLVDLYSTVKNSNSELNLLIQAKDERQAGPSGGIISVS